MAQSWDGCSFSKSSMKLTHFMVKHLEHIPVQPCSKALLFAGRNAYIASWEISPGNWATSIFSEGSLKRSFDVDVLVFCCYMIPLNTQKTDKKKNTIFGLHMFPPYFWWIHRLFRNYHSFPQPLPKKPRRSWIPGAGPEWQHATSIFVTTVKSDEVGPRYPTDFLWAQMLMSNRNLWYFWGNPGI